MLKKIIPTILYFSLCACSTTYPAQTDKISAAEINTKLALAYLDHNDAARGKAKLLLAQKQAPLDPAVWYVSGYFWERTGERAAANQAYLNAIKLAPTLGAAQNNYGAFLCRQGQYSAAISHFLLAIADPNYLSIVGAYENAAQCALKIPNRALAEEYLHLANARAGSH